MWWKRPGLQICFLALCQDQEVVCILCSKPR